MKTWYVIWTYIANYGKLKVQAKTADEAVNKVRAIYSPDFTAKAEIHVFAEPPACSYGAASRCHHSAWLTL